MSLTLEKGRAGVKVENVDADMKSLGNLRLGLLFVESCVLPIVIQNLSKSLSLRRSQSVSAVIHDLMVIEKSESLEVWRSIDFFKLRKNTGRISPN
jgi:hypothetical protein